MIYSVKIRTVFDDNEKYLFYAGDEKFCASSAKLTKGLNIIGSLTMTIPPNNLSYDLLQELSIVNVYRDDVLYWRGFISEITYDFYKNAEIFCKGELAWLDNSIIPAQKLSSTATTTNALNTAINAYNANVSNDEAIKKFSRGTVTWDSGLNQRIIGYGNTSLDMIYFECPPINEGNRCIVTRHTEDKTYIDFLTLNDYVTLGTQKIEFGRNLLDFVKSIDTSNMCNWCKGYGEETEEILVGDIKKRIEYTSASTLPASVNKYGMVVKTIIFDDATTSTQVRNKQNQYVQAYGMPTVTMEITAVDLAYIDSSIDSFEVGQAIRVVAEPFDVDMNVVIVSEDIDFLNPANNKYTLSNATNLNLTITQIATQSTKNYKRIIK